MSFSNLLLSDLPLFTSEILRAPPKLGPFDIPDHFERWANCMRQHKRTLFMSARGLGKTLCLSYAYPIWAAAGNPRSHTAIFTSSDTRARKRLRHIRREIETNPKLHSLCPDKGQRRGEAWSSNLIRLRNGAEIEAIGFNSRARGEHPNRIILDDVLGDDSLYSDLVRKKSIANLRGAIEPMLEPDGELRIVGTPFSELDMYAHVQADPNYRTMLTPAIRPDGFPEWGERFSLEFLASRRQSVGEIIFSREYMCKPASDLASLFPSHLFENIWTDYVFGMSGSYWREKGIEYIISGVDFARSAEQKADSTAIVTWGVDGQGVHWLLDIQKFKGLPYQAQLNKILMVNERMKPDLFAFEKNAMQQLFADGLSDTDLPIVLIQTGTEKHTLDKGVPSLRILFENGKMRAPKEDKLALEWAAELQAFTFIEGKVISTGKHDDLAMAWLHGERAAREYIGMSFGTGADDAEIEDDAEWRELQEDLAGHSITGDESFDGGGEGFDAEGMPSDSSGRGGWGADGVWRENPKTLAEERRRLETPQPFDLMRMF